MPLKVVSTASPESAEIIRTFLESHATGVLATVGKTKQPHAAVVYYALRDDFSLVFGTKTETQKFKDAEENAQVSFVIYDEQAQTTVQISGRLEMINDPYEQKAALDNMFASSERLSHRPTPPIDKIESGEYVVLQLLPVVIKLARYGHVESDDDDELYETLLFTEA